jgi:2-keto-4-pentenoate hydratase/2-oxohepta-3-ene-1,7-dioic acid hydratase in catechol pathway
MRLVTYRANVEAAARLGAVVEDMVVDVEKIGAHAGVALPASMLDLIDLGPPGTAALKKILQDHAGDWPVGAATPRANVRLLAPIPRPRKNIFGIGLNYVEHVAESSRALDTSKDLPKQPIIFSKPPTSVIGPDDAIEHNKTITQQLDWEVELAVVMGRTARRVSEAQALDLWLTVNGVEKQRSNTRHMLFKVPLLISDISAAMTLEPGDIIATGTPDGVGAGRTPQEWLWPGDVVEAEVAGIGRLRHPVVAV